MNIILKRPIITEKAMKLADQGFYTFEVGKNANKLEIAKMVMDKFKVDVVNVKTINVKGEVKMQRRARSYYETAGVKKAIVQVKKGQKIAIFETPKEETVEVVSAGESEPIVREKKSFLRNTKVKIEKGADVPTVATQRKVITGK